MKKFLRIFLAALLLFSALSCDELLEEDPAADDGTGDGDGDGGGGEATGLGYFEVSGFDPLVGLTEAQVREHYAANYASTESAESAVTGYDKAGRQKGELTEAAIKDFVRRTNFFRAFHQLPPVDMPDNATNAKCQEAALSMIIQSDISHTPKDEGFTYATDVAQDAASSSNLAIAWGQYSYTDLLNNLVMDTGVSSTGHRKWFLLPGQKGAGYGYLYRDDDPSYDKADTLVQWAFEYEDVSSSWDKPVLFPPAGAFPIEFAIDGFGTMVDFTLYWEGASFNNCTVAIKKGTTTIANTITEKEAYDPNGMPPGALIFQPASQPAAGDSWTITISGISGKSQSTLTYTVNFFELGISRAGGSAPGKRKVLK